MSGRLRKTPEERAWERYQAAHPFPSSDRSRADCLLNVLLCDNSGGQDLLDFSDDHIVEIVRLARQVRDELRQLNAEEHARGTLTLVVGGRE